jgi:cytosine/adenosine deaminase-related metal-dependent hydrolase
VHAVEGSLLTLKGWRQGHLLLERGRVVEVGKGTARGVPVTARGVVVPSFANAHTHVGDAVARGPGVPKTLAEAVQPPHGYKHRVLASTPPAALREGMRGALREVEASGAGLVVDFREGGPAGVRMLRDAARGLGLRLRALARPLSLDFGAEEVRSLLRDADGLAISSLPDYGEDRAAMLAGAADAAGKPFALHASEPQREPIAPVLDLKPALVVHLTHATPADLEAVRDAGCAAVVCPRSNLRWLGKLPDVARMLALGLPVGLGSDNAMLGPCDVLAEARTLLQACPEIRPDEVLGMLCFGGRALTGPADPLAEGAAADFLVFPPKGSNPAAAVLADGAKPMRRERGLGP